MKKFMIIFMVATTITACKKQNEPALAQETLTEEFAAAPNPCTGNTWAEIPNYPWANSTNFPRFLFVYQNKIYVPSKQEQKVYIYDGISWSRINSVVPEGFNAGFCFTIGDKGYISKGGILDGRELWEYNVVTNVWTQKATFPGAVRFFSASFVIGNKAYIAGGNYGSTYFREVWEYDPTDVTPWTQKANIPVAFLGRSGSTGFSIGTKGYIACGEYKTPASPFIQYTKTLLEYNPTTDAWTQKTNFPGAGMSQGASFVIGQSGYVGAGYTGTISSKVFYKYSPSSNTWVKIALMPNQEAQPIGCSINSKGYVSGLNRLVKYSPQICIGGVPF